MKVVLLALLLAMSGVVAIAPGAEACLHIYNEAEVGPVKVIQRSSCQYEVCVEDDCERIK